MRDTTNLTIEALEPIRLPIIKRLYQQHYKAGKPKKDELIITAQIDNQTVAVVRFRTIESFRLLTGMLVLPEYRGGEVGKALLAHCRDHVLNTQDYCFAYSYLEEYYTGHGFTTIDKELLPASLKALLLRYTSSGKDLIPMQFNG